MQVRILLKRLVLIKVTMFQPNEVDGIVSNEDFQLIKELKDEGYEAATFKIPSSEQLSAKCLNPIKLEAHVRSKLSKQERVALLQVDRDWWAKQQAEAALEGDATSYQKSKSSSFSSREKKQQRQGGKQFRGRKAWK
ncbi:hypothetical protein HPP92_027083 [Vanilla planifolia]|uniref:Uncharacterized protein n=1 Tax=Vanilla planifolia TaxID=51239 RepID=A0A835U6D5_VANPL|nr:hypothetical protein HPP92_027083 [Vanilla planifolia]